MTDSQQYRPITQVTAVEGFMMNQEADGMICVVPTGSIIDSPGLTEINQLLVATPQFRTVHNAIHLLTPLQDCQSLIVSLDRVEAAHLGMPSIVVVQSDGLQTPLFTLVTEALMAADQAGIQHLVMPLYQPRPSPLDRPNEQLSAANVLDQIAQAVETYRVSPGLGNLSKITVAIAPNSVANPEALCANFNRRFDPTVTEADEN